MREIIMAKVRTRFAPSPTGDLHIGGARTALFAWAYAKAHGGTCVLRIEDTDQQRHQEQAVAGIIEGLDWLGLDDLEGPYFQSERISGYRVAIDKLLASGDAYRCRCSQAQLTALREAQMASGDKPRYNGCCRDANYPASDEPFVVRFRTPQTGVVAFDDRVRGLIETENAELDDLIIARSDGSPTYNLTVVVDDIDMQISHVIRGEDHINNTPRQIHIFNALGHAAPMYAHVSSILAEDGKKLSKRRGALGILAYRDQGYMPEALMNYLIRLGWSHQDDEVLSREEIINYFGFSGMQRSPATLSNDKLQWLNQHYMKALDSNLIAMRLVHFLSLSGCDWENGPNLNNLVNVFSQRSKTLLEMAQKVAFIYEREVIYNDTSAKKWLTMANMALFEYFLVKFEAVEDWTSAALHEIVVVASQDFDCKMVKIAQPLRVAMTGNTISPSIGDTLSLLGKAHCIERLKRACIWMQSNAV